MRKDNDMYYKKWEHMGDYETAIFLYDMMELAQKNNVQPNEIMRLLRAQRREEASIQRLQENSE